MKLPPLYIGTNTFYSKYADLGLGNNSVTSFSNLQNWVNDRALYIPFVLPWPYPVKRFWYQTAPSASGTPNFEIGVYSAGGTKIVSSGIINQTVVNTIQFKNAQYLLSPGSYYFAIVIDTPGLNSIAAYFLVSAVMGRAMGMLQQDSAYPLPGVMTPAQSTFTMYPVWGMTMTES
jgi:hypothetical protein